MPNIHEITIERIKICPEMALEMLDHNTDNRKLRPAQVTKLARDMQEGRWIFNGEPIVFDTNGKLKQGQHRLFAIVESEMPFEFIVVRGVQPEAMSTYDIGARRTYADVLLLRGEKNASGLAGAVKMHWQLEMKSYSDHRSMVSNGELDEHLARHPEIRDALDISTMIQSGCRLPIRVGATFFAYASMLPDISDDLSVFVEGLRTGAGLAADSPILKLRTAILANYPSKKQYNTWHMLALVIKAWNMYRTGKTVQILSYKTGGASPEQFPVIK